MLDEYSIPDADEQAENQGEPVRAPLVISTWSGVVGARPRCRSGRRRAQVGQAEDVVFEPSQVEGELGRRLGHGPTQCRGCGEGGVHKIEQLRIGRRDERRRARIDCSTAAQSSSVCHAVIEVPGVAQHPVRRRDRRAADAEPRGQLTLGGKLLWRGIRPSRTSRRIASANRT